MPPFVRLAALALLLPAAAAAQGAGPPSNTNTWQVIRPDGSDRRVSANAAEVNAAGALSFTIRYGATVFVVQSFAPGEWRCLRAIALRGERGESYAAPPAQGC